MNTTMRGLIIFVLLASVVAIFAVKSQHKEAGEAKPVASEIVKNEESQAVVTTEEVVESEPEPVKETEAVKEESQVEAVADVAVDVPVEVPAEVPAAVERKALPKLVDLGADKCIPCKAMAGILDELEHKCEGQLDVVFIDVWKNPDAGREYGIRLIPTQIFFDADGNELFRHEGFFSKEDILAKWKEFGIDLVL